ncbi:MAG: acylphosphatase [Bacteroidota bacterium]
MSDSTRQYEIRIFGRVQGVGFRYAARNQARSLNLKGWVKNLHDGSVRATIQGDENSCGAFFQWCRSGTGYSWVERVEITEKELELFKAFVVK